MTACDIFFVGRFNGRRALGLWVDGRLGDVVLFGFFLNFLCSKVFWWFSRPASGIVLVHRDDGLRSDSCTSWSRQGTLRATVVELGSVISLSRS